MSPSVLDEPGRVLTVVGACCIVVGGLVAAGTGPLALTHGSWLAAYLVLVGGVAQYTMGRAPQHLTGRSWSRPLGWSVVGCWNAGNLGVVGGTLTQTPWLVDVGAAPLVVALVMALRSANEPATDGRRLHRWAYLGLLTLLLVCIPIGMMLAHIRAG